LRELWNEYLSHKARAERAHEATVAMAWHVENFSRYDKTKPLPTLKVLFAQVKGRQEPQDQLQAMYQISAIYGLKVRTRKADGQRQADKK